MHLNSWRFGSTTHRTNILCIKIMDKIAKGIKPYRRTDDDDDDDEAADNNRKHTIHKTFGTN